MFAQNDALSLLGTPFIQEFGKCLPGADTSICPWDRVEGIEKFTKRPDVGITRYYDFTISQGTFAPDGVDVQMIVANGQFPGPLVECNWGDTLEVTVHNNMSTEGSALHWHGILQHGKPEMDGVPGVSQCPIAPGSSFTYRFKPDLYGTSWWHSHWEGQYSSGLAGPLIVHGPTHVDYDIDVGPIAVNDWFHEYYNIISAGFLENTPKVTLSDNNLINGKNSFGDNGAPLASFSFRSGKVHRLRLINSAAFAVEKITIDGYTMTVIANDYVPVEPYETDVVTLSPGQRTDVLVHGNGAPTDSMWLRAYKSPDCSPGRQGSYMAIAGIFYEDADRSKPPTTQPGPHAFDDYCGNDPLSKTIPKFPLQPSEPSTTQILPVELRSNGTAQLWYMGNRTLRIDFNKPQLLAAESGNYDFPYIQNVQTFEGSSSVRFVVENPGNIIHPMHIHGHNFWVLQEGPCNNNETVFPRGRDGQEGYAMSAREMSHVYGGNHGNLRRASHDSRDVRLSPLGEIEEAREVIRAETATYIGEYGTCWDGSIVNPSNPQRRDVQNLLPRSYTVLQWDLDNPGIWAFHCHIAWHLSGGMAMLILERPEELKTLKVSDTIEQTCGGWNAYTSDHVVEPGAGMR